MATSKYEGTLNYLIAHLSEVIVDLSNFIFPQHITLLQLTS